MSIKTILPEMYRTLPEREMIFVARYISTNYDLFDAAWLIWADECGTVEAARALGEKVLASMRVRRIMALHCLPSTTPLLATIVSWAESYADLAPILTWYGAVAAGKFPADGGK